MILAILLTLYTGIELIIFYIRSMGKRRRERMTLQSLYKLMEIRVLNRTLQGGISTELATQFEYQQMFVRIEFLDAKPWMAYLYAVDECITIGRCRDNKVYIRDDLLSRMHCKIVAQNNVLYLQDMGTTNGTRVKKGFFQKVTLAPQGVIVLESGNIIYLGHYRLKIKIYYGTQVYH